MAERIDVRDLDERECWKCGERREPIHAAIMTVVTERQSDSQPRLTELYIGTYKIALCDDCRKELRA